jgi:hypothetical protein
MHSLDCPDGLMQHPTLASFREVVSFSGGRRESLGEELTSWRSWGVRNSWEEAWARTADRGGDPL